MFAGAALPRASTRLELGRQQVDAERVEEGSEVGRVGEELLRAAQKRERDNTEQRSRALGAIRRRQAALSRFRMNALSSRP